MTAATCRTTAPRFALSLALALVAVAAAASAGCGGETFAVSPDAGGPGTDAAVDVGPGGDAGGNDTGAEDSAVPDAGAHDGGDADAPPAPDAGPPVDGSTPDAGPALGCPHSPPADGAACAAAGLACEYGLDPQLSCDTVATCQSGAWSVAKPSSSTQCAVTTSPTCPAAFSDVTQGASCTVEATCDYSEARCSCAVQCGGGLCAAQVDGGANLKTWGCDVPRPPTACPVPRPRLGAPCTQPMLGCDYGGCSGNVYEQCSGGIWQQEFLGCPAGVGVP